MDTEKNSIIPTTKLFHFSYGVASDGKIMIISDSVSKCTTENLNNMSHTFLEGMGEVFRISSFQENIYGINYYEKSLLR